MIGTNSKIAFKYLCRPPSAFRQPSLPHARVGNRNGGNLKLVIGTRGSPFLEVEGALLTSDNDVRVKHSLALAALETFVNLGPNLQPDDLVSIQGEVPDDLQVGHLDLNALPAARQDTRDESLRRFGDEWIQAETTVALLVPSAAVRGERNILLNPIHADFPKLRFENPRSFKFDARMFR